jgi:hypothetical protein
MKAIARIALALITLMTISACVVDPGHDGGWDHGGHDRGYYR